MLQDIQQTYIGIRHSGFLSTQFQIIHTGFQISTPNEIQPLLHLIFIDKASVRPFAFGREKHIQVKLVELSLHSDLTDTIRDAVSHHHHAGQCGIRIIVTFPMFLCPLFIRVCPVVNLILDKFAGIQRPKRRTGQIEIIHGCDGEERFIVGVATVIRIHILTVVAVLVLLLKQLFGVFLPCSEMVLVKNNQIPVGGMYPFVFCLDAAGFPIHSQIILKRAKADDGTGLVRRFIGQFRIPANKLPAFKINVAVQVLLPCADHSRLEGQNQNPLESHFLCQLIGCKGFAEAHFAVPQKLGVACRVLLISTLKISGGFVHGFLLFRAHGEAVDPILRIGSMVFDGQHRRPHIIDRAAKPFTAHAGNLLAFQSTVNIMVRERGAVRIHGTFPIDNAIGNTAVRSFGGILLGHTLVHINGGIAHLQKPLILRIGVLVGINHRVGMGALWEKISRHNSHLPNHH